MKTLNSRFKGNTLDLGRSVAVKTVGRPSVPGGSALSDTAMRHFRRSPRVLTCRNTPRTASPSGACAASTKLGYLSEFQWTTCSWKGGTRRDAGVIVQNSLEAEEQTQQRHRCAGDARAHVRRAGHENPDRSRLFAPVRKPKQRGEGARVASQGAVTGRWGSRGWGSRTPRQLRPACPACPARLRPLFRATGVPDGKLGRGPAGEPAGEPRSPKTPDGKATSAGLTEGRCPRGRGGEGGS